MSPSSKIHFLEASTAHGTQRGGCWHDLPSGHLTSGLKGAAHGARQTLVGSRKKWTPTPACAARSSGPSDCPTHLVCAGACPLVSDLFPGSSGHFGHLILAQFSPVLISHVPNLCPHC